MKTLTRRNIVIFVTFLSVVAFVTPALGWVQAPTEETGYYYMYDDQSDPPFMYPALSVHAPGILFELHYPQ